MSLATPHTNTLLALVLAALVGSTVVACNSGGGRSTDATMFDDAPADISGDAQADVDDAGDDSNTTDGDDTQTDTGIDAAPDTRLDQDTRVPDGDGASALCGNGVIDDGELCDGDALGGATCESRGLDGGDLRCADSCEAYDESGCSASCDPSVDAERCRDDQVEICVLDGSWQALEACTGTDEVCVLVNDGDAECVVESAIPEGEPCDVAAGDECRAGLSCIDAIDGGDTCLVSCAGDPAVCGPSRFCDDSGTFYVESVCLPRRDRDEACLLGDYPESCVDGLSCVPAGSEQPAAVSGRDHGECEQLCDPADIGTTGPCTPDADGNPTICLFSGERADGPLVYDVTDTCDPQNDTCPTFAGPTYRCTQVEDGGTMIDVCASPPGYCGTRATRPGTLDDTLLMAADPSDMCDTPGPTRLCGGLRATAGGSPATAEVMCESIFYEQIYSMENQAHVACEDDADCLAHGTGCLNVSGGNRCGFVQAYCVAYCESVDGLRATGTLTCPSGQTCKAHDLPIIALDFVVQYSGDEQVLCATDADCDARSGFACTRVAGIDVCVRPRKVCLP